MLWGFMLIRGGRGRKWKNWIGQRFTEQAKLTVFERHGGGMRAVVTGGAGFLGSHLCDRLLAEGWEVLALDNLITGSEANIAHLGGNAKFRYEKRDVSEPLRVAGEVNYIFHFASPASPPDYLKYPIETLKVGSIATMHALDLALEKKAKYLLASTSECYGDPEVSPQSESYWGRVNPVGPRSVYDEAKRFAEAIDGIFRLSQSDEHFPTNIGNPAELTILEFAERIRAEFPNAPKIIYEPLPEDDPKQRRPDISKAKKLLGWEPKVSLEEGLRHTLKYFKEQYVKMTQGR